MMSEEDPFTLVQVPRRPRAHPCASRLLRARHRSRRSQEEASRSLLDVQAQLAHWRELSSSTSEMDHTEANQVKVHLTATIGELQVRAPSPLRPAPPTASTANASNATSTATRHRHRSRARS